MPEYKYTALNTEDEKVAGTINAADFKDAVTKIKKLKKFPLTVTLIYAEGLSSEQKIEYRKRYGMSMKSQNPLIVFIDRIYRNIRLRSFKKKEELKRQNLLLRKDEIISNTFAILDSHLRKASIAQLGGFRPPEDPLCSWFGDVLVCKEGEQWPSWKHPVSLETVLLTPLAQFNLTEAPFVPEKLKRFKMITVFIDGEELPFDTPYGDGWIVKAYESLDDLVPLKKPNFDFEIKPFPMKWELIENEGPVWEDACDITDMSEFNLVTDSEYEDRYENSERTKLGGHPTLLQGRLQFNMNDYVFQIGTEDKAEWMWGDSGIGYFGLNDAGKWLFEWTCY